MSAVASREPPPEHVYVPESVSWASVMVRTPCESLKRDEGKSCTLVPFGLVQDRTTSCTGDEHVTSTVLPISCFTLSGETVMFFVVSDVSSFATAQFWLQHSKINSPTIA